MADVPTCRTQQLPQKGLPSLGDCAYDEDQAQPVDLEQGQPSSGRAVCVDASPGVPAEPLVSCLGVRLRLLHRSMGALSRHLPRRTAGPGIAPGRACPAPCRVVPGPVVLGNRTCWTLCLRLLLALEDLLSLHDLGGGRCWADRSPAAGAATGVPGLPIERRSARVRFRPCTATYQSSSRPTPTLQGRPGVLCLRFVGNIGRGSQGFLRRSWSTPTPWGPGSRSDPGADVGLEGVDAGYGHPVAAAWW